MIPTIHKPCAYKSPGIYKGAGGVYNGRGLYKDGAGSVDPNLIYEFNLNQFDLNTLKDGNVQWYNYNEGSPANLIILQKIDDFLRLNFSYGTKQFFGLIPNELNLNSDNFSCEVEYSGTYPYMSYIMCMGGAYIRAENGHTDGLWTSILGAWDLRFSFVIYDKVNVKLYFAKNSSYFDVKCYVNGSYIGQTQSDYNFNGTTYEATNVDYNGYSSDGYINMHKFVLKRENAP